MNYQVLVARKERKLKQKDIAKKLMLSRQAYSRKENGTQDFTETEMKRLAKFYGMTLDELFN